MMLLTDNVSIEILFAPRMAMNMESKRGQITGYIRLKVNKRLMDKFETVELKLFIASVIMKSLQFMMLFGEEYFLPLCYS